MVDKTIIAAGGGDYTSITAWEAASDVTSSPWKGIISDASVNNYAAVTISGSTGTDSATNYVWLTADSNNQATTEWDAARSSITNTSNGTHCVTLGDNYSRISGIQIYQNSSGGSDEGIRITATTDTLIERCHLRCNGTAADTDGVYMGNVAGTTVVAYCIAYNFQRAGFHPQNYSAGSVTQDWTFDNCTAVKCGATSEAESGGFHSQTASTNTNNIAVFNNFAGDTASTYDDFSESGAGTTNWSGTHNGCSDTSLTNLSIATSAQESLTVGEVSQGSGSHAVFVDITAGTEDYALLDGEAGNLLHDNGTDRSASEPDSRSDYSLDINLDTITTQMIGADFFVAPPVGGGPPPLMTLLGVG